MIKPPGETEFAERLNSFFWDILYVPKALKRNELFYAKYMFDNICRFNKQQVFIEWYIGLKHDWMIGTNKCGRQFREYLDRDFWARTEKTFAGSGEDENWQALDAMVNQVCTLARYIAAEMGFSYPEAQEAGIRLYIDEIRKSVL